jgi:ribA/ribD-fused uncharacterized protein
MASTIYFYRPYEKWGFLSQWYPSSFSEETGVRTKYSNAEQYMMAKKALQFGDMEIHQLIMSTSEPGAIQKLGKRVRGFNEEVWDDKKFEIVLQGNMLKFTQNKELAQKLLETGDTTLAESSPSDRIWGIGITTSDAVHGKEWKGQNLLGKALTEVRRRVSQE